MARLKSEDKRNALVAAAVQVIAREGLSAPTARIAKQAHVAHGSLFNYFQTKNDLLNELYLELKADLRAAIMDGFPQSDDLRERMGHIWMQWVDWGTSAPDKHKALAQLRVSELVTEQTRRISELNNADLIEIIRQSSAHGALRGRPVAFVNALMEAMAGATMDFIIRNPKEADDYRRSGFAAFWSAIAKP